MRRRKNFLTNPALPQKLAIGAVLFFLLALPVALIALNTKTNTQSKALVKGSTARPFMKGLAPMDGVHRLQDLATLKATHFYNWGEWCGTLANCFNMVRNWDVNNTTIPQSCYPTMLLGNEPTNPEPAGHPIFASTAVDATIKLEKRCPNTKIVATNIHINNAQRIRDMATCVASQTACTTSQTACCTVLASNAWETDLQWLTDYLSLYKSRTGHKYGSEGRNIIGLHCYEETGTNSPYKCLDRFDRVMKLTDYYGNFWVTEFASFANYNYPASSNPTIWQTRFQAMLDYWANNPRIEAAFVWTNRGHDVILGVPYIDLVGSNGQLINNGPAYAAWTGPRPLGTLPTTLTYHVTPGVCDPGGRVEVNVRTMPLTLLGRSVRDTIKVYGAINGAALGFLKDFRTAGGCDTDFNAYRTGDFNYPGEYYRFGGSKKSFREKGLPRYVRVQAWSAPGTPPSTTNTAKPLSEMSGRLDLGLLPPEGRRVPAPLPQNLQFGYKNLNLYPNTVSLSSITLTWPAASGRQLNYINFKSAANRVWDGTVTTSPTTIVVNKGDKVLPENVEKFLQLGFNYSAAGTGSYTITANWTDSYGDTYSSPPIVAKP